jgi:hypothetical protein
MVRIIAGHGFLMTRSRPCRSARRALLVDDRRVDARERQYEPGRAVLRPATA